ncbi:MAG: hypothetical protein AAGG51_12820 [Cyanobacteria bacterium P01_G01_bin.54]
MEREGHWLRWWDSDGNLLLWSQEQRDVAEARAEKLLAQLRAAGIEPAVD